MLVNQAISLDVMNLSWQGRQSHSVLCLGCGVQTRDLELTVKSETAEYGFYRCIQCQSLTSHPAPPTNKQAYGQIGDAGLNHYLDIGAGVESLINAVPNLREGDVFVEVGCGFGFPLAYARNQDLADIEVHGVDESFIAEEGSRAFGFELHLPFGKSLEGKATVILASEVIEHTESPPEFMGYLYNQMNLEVGCEVVITTPNAVWIDKSRDSTVLLAALSPGFHTCILSPKALAAIAGKYFDSFTIAEKSESLILSGHVGPKRSDTKRPLGYFEFLNRQMDKLGLENARLKAGLGFRLFKELVNKGNWIEAERLSEFLSNELLQNYSIDVLRFGSSADLERFEGSCKSELGNHLSQFPGWLSVFCFYLAGLKRGDGDVGGQIHLLELSRKLFSIEIRSFPVLAQEANSLMSVATERLAEAASFLSFRYGRPKSTIGAWVRRRI